MFSDLILSLRIEAFSKSSFSLASSICFDKFFWISLDFPDINFIAFDEEHTDIMIFGHINQAVIKIKNNIFNKIRAGIYFEEIKNSNVLLSKNVFTGFESRYKNVLHF